MVRTEPGKRKRISALVCGCLAVLLLAVFIFDAASRSNKLKRVEGREYTISPSMCEPTGFFMEDGAYIPRGEGAYIQLPEIGRYVFSLRISFSQPLTQEKTILISCTGGDGAPYTKTVHGKPGETVADAMLDREAAGCRIAIIRTDDTMEDTGFSLAEIVLNDADGAADLGKLYCFRNAVFLVLLLVLLAVFYLLLNCRPAKEGLFAGLVFVFGLFYCVVITPLSPPDETVHYQSAYEVSNYILLRWDDPLSGDARDFDFAGLSNHYNTSGAYLRILEGGAVAGERGEAVRFLGGVSYFVQYLPQALGLAAGRLTRLPFMPLFLLGRIFNLIFYTACVYLSVRRAPRSFKTLLGLIALLPMALQQAASYSCDGYINGLAFVLTASIAGAIYGEGLLPRKDYFWILVPGALLAPAKVVYCSILLAVFLIPAARFSGKKGRAAALAAVFTTAAAFALVFQAGTLFTVATASGDFLNWEGQHNYTLAFVFGHPVQTVMIFLRTLAKYLVWWVFQAVGGALGGLTLRIPFWIIACIAANTALAALNHKDGGIKITMVQRIVYLGIVCVVVALVMLSMFLGWTSDTRLVIEGVQGRYFLPVVPLALMCLNNQKLVLPKDPTGINAAVCAALHTAVVWSVLLYTIG